VQVTTLPDCDDITRFDGTLISRQILSSSNIISISRDYGKKGIRPAFLLIFETEDKTDISGLTEKHYCCGTETIYSGSDSDFGKVSIPVPNTDPDPDYI
jgi:hypothetical protein